MVRHGDPTGATLCKKFYAEWFELAGIEEGEVGLLIIELFGLLIIELFNYYRIVLWLDC